jgi:cell division septation protein DedD
MAGLLLLLAVPAAASTSDGVRKWQAGDWPGAVAEWTQPAAAGDPDALFNMGQAYRLGRGVPANGDVAIDYYRRASARGHLAATANLGITLYQSGRKAEALTPLRAAADRGDARAAYVLGLATFSGDGAPKNPALGLAYVLRAQELGLDLAAPQVARLSSLLGADDRARAAAAAEALRTGSPVAVALAPTGPTAPPPATAATPTAPVAAPATAAASTPATMGDNREWRVQLGAYASEPAARTAWATLVAQMADLLDGQSPVYSPRGSLVRLQVGPFSEREAAAALCARLAAAGRPCFVTAS